MEPEAVREIGEDLRLELGNPIQEEVRHRGDRDTDDGSHEEENYVTARLDDRCRVGFRGRCRVGRHGGVRHCPLLRRFIGLRCAPSLFAERLN
jgi:hypothetical protein